MPPLDSILHHPLYDEPREDSVNKSWSLHTLSSSMHISEDEDTARSTVPKPRPPRSTRSKARPGLRKGKWTLEEEQYAMHLNQCFKLGLLTLPKGTMLRLFLAEQLNCEPMRITKKFTGDECVGKQVYRACIPTAYTEYQKAQAQVELAALRARFLAKINRSSTNGNKRAHDDCSSSDEAEHCEPRNKTSKVAEELSNYRFSRPTNTTVSDHSITLTFMSTPKLIPAKPSPQTNASRMLPPLDNVQKPSGGTLSSFRLGSPAVGRPSEEVGAGLLLGFINAVNYSDTESASQGCEQLRNSTARYPSLSAICA